MKKRIALVLVVLLLAAAVFANGSKETGKKTFEMAGLSGGMQSFPAWLAEKNGWFDELGLDVNITYFENGPVQMEAISSWDVATTGIGGVLKGAINGDAVVIATGNSDDGTQYIFARKDSDIVKAGKGHNTLNPEIYGDAASWKGKQVLCSAGTVLQYLLIKTLGGFGLTINDVEFVGMDTPACNSAFLQGTGDVTVITGVISFAEDKKDLVAIGSGNMAHTGLDCSVVAAPKAVKEKHDEIELFLKGYFRAVDWIKANRNEAVDLLTEFCEESGKSSSREANATFINAENFYSIEDNYNFFHTLDSNGVSEMENRSLNVLKFFIEAGNYAKGDDELFKGHMDSSFIDALYK